MTVKMFVFHIQTCGCDYRQQNANSPSGVYEQRLTAQHPFTELED